MVCAAIILVSALLAALMPIATSSTVFFSLSLPVALATIILPALIIAILFLHLKWLERAETGYEKF